MKIQIYISVSGFMILNMYHRIETSLSKLPRQPPEHYLQACDSIDFNLPDLFLVTWSDVDSVLRTPDNPDGDFELYSSMSFALAGLMHWKFYN